MSRLRDFGDIETIRQAMVAGQRQTTKRKEIDMETQEETMPHIIYGYRCKTGKRTDQWKIGCTLQQQEKARHWSHKKGRSGCRLFDNYLRKRFREGYSFDDVFVYFQLHESVCTRREAERLEDIYTDRYFALAPNGFCLHSGRYGGRHSEESKRLVSENLIGRTKETHEYLRRQSEKVRSYNKENCEGLRRLSEKMKGNKNSCKQNWLEEAIKRFEKKREENKLRSLVKKAKSKKTTRMSNTKLVELIVINANKGLTEREVVREMNRMGRKVSRAGTPLLRACRINARTGKDMPTKELARIVRGKDKNKTFFMAKHEFTAWMIPDAK